MGSTSEPASGVHLVGSINLPDTQTVFTTVPPLLPNRLKRLPDGETGHRSIFIQWQAALFTSHPHILGTVNPKNYKPDAEPSISAKEVEETVRSLPELHTGYDTHALASYDSFKAYKEKGAIHPKTRFQVSLPTPPNVISLLAAPYRLPIEPLYTRALHASLQTIHDSIPHADLAIQIDIAIDIAILEGVGPWTPYFSPVFEGVVERAVAMINQIPSDVEVGLHLCYGDLGHVHFVEPRDLSLLVRLANAINNSATRPLTWIHVPVPKSRVDEAYFSPLRSLRVGEAELYLGLVHFGDEEGTWRRMETARAVLGGRAFGVATECGMGRTPGEEFEGIMGVLRGVSGEVV